MSMQDAASGVALWRQVADGIERGIAEGRFAAGERLPGETEIAETYRVNRHTVRRALAVLAERGLVRAERGSGTYVEAPRLAYPLRSRTRFSEIVGAGGREPRGQLVAASEEPATEPAPAPAAKPSPKRETGYSEPPMPVEPPRPGSAPETPPAAPAKAPKAAYAGNAHVTPEREAALMAMVQTRTWPASAAERLKAGDDLNDLGKTAEANLAYAKALAAEGVNEKQKISALGGLAVTFQSMGMKEQARDAVEKILAINPKNGFALKLKGKLE